MINRNFKKFAIGYTFILLSFQSVQQYVTIRYNELGYTAVGFNALILIYVFFILGSFIAPVVISKSGPKKSMIGAAIFYILYDSSAVIIRKVHKYWQVGHVIFHGGGINLQQDARFFRGFDCPISQIKSAWLDSYCIMGLF
jgi:isoprenylcysteine carboxyl methyltransferase (ICMT) family protein YpbQ